MASYLLISLIITICLSNSREYIYVREYLSWFEAMDYCSSNYNTYLATIISDNDMDKAFQTIENRAIDNDQLAWIGLEDIDSDLHWKWGDSTKCKLSSSPLCTNYWSTNTVMTGDCVLLSIDPNNPGFIATSCYDRRGFLCNAPNNDSDNDEHVDIGCNYLHNDGHGFPINECNEYNHDYERMSYKYLCDEPY